jgi:hypothetical protein
MEGMDVEILISREYDTKAEDIKKALLEADFASPTTRGWGQITRCNQTSGY